MTQQAAVENLTERMLTLMTGLDPVYGPLFEGYLKRGEYALQHFPVDRRPVWIRPCPGRRKGTIFFVTDRPDFGGGYGPEGIHAETLFRIIRMSDYILPSACDCSDCEGKKNLFGEAMRKASLGCNIFLLDCWPATAQQWGGLFEGIVPAEPQAGRA